MSDQGQMLAEVSDTASLCMALAAGYPPERIVIAHPISAQSLNESCEAAREEGYAAGKRDADERHQVERAQLIEQAMNGVAPDAAAAIATAERDRILQIQAITEPGFEKGARQAIVEGLGLEQFALRQMQAIRDRGITLTAIRADSPPPAPHALPPDYGSDRAPRHRNNASAIYERRKADAEGSRR